MAFSLASVHCAIPKPSGVEDPLARLVRLYEDRRYFELRDSVARMREAPSPEMEFFMGAVDEAFNRLDSAITHLEEYVRGEEEGRPGHRLAKEAWFLLSDAFRRKGQYGKVAETLRTVLHRFGPAITPGEGANILSQISYWSALAGIPPQEVEIRENTTIRMENRIFPVIIEGQAFPFGYDTGSSFSIMPQSVADKLGIPTFGQSTRIQTSTGIWIDGRTGVVREMRLASIVIRNAVFLVLPDNMFPSSHPGFGIGRSCLLGAPVLAGLRELTETRDGRLIIPASPPPRPEQNLCFSGFMPIVDVLYRGAHVSLCLDTGASATYLYPPFLRRFGGEIKARSRPRKVTLSGVGNSLPVTFHILHEFAFRVGGQGLVLRRIAVHTRPTHSNTEKFFGTLGLDILGQCSRMTINTESMSFVLE